MVLIASFFPSQTSWPLGVLEQFVRKTRRRSPFVNLSLEPQARTEKQVCVTGKTKAGFWQKITLTTVKRSKCFLCWWHSPSREESRGISPCRLVDQAASIRLGGGRGGPGNKSSGFLLKNYLSSPSDLSATQHLSHPFQKKEKLSRDGSAHVTLISGNPWSPRLDSFWSLPPSPALSTFPAGPPALGYFFFLSLMCKANFLGKSCRISEHWR